MTIKAKRSGGATDVGVHGVHPLEAERLRTGQVPEGWHSGMVKAPEGGWPDTSHIKPNFEGMPGGVDEPYDAMKDARTTRATIAGAERTREY